MFKRVLSQALSLCVKLILVFSLFKMESFERGGAAIKVGLNLSINLLPTAIIGQV